MGAFIRIAMRYGAMFLVTRGWLSAEDGASFATDPDIEMLIGAAVIAVTEGWYVLARRYGWAK